VIGTVISSLLRQIHCWQRGDYRGGRRLSLTSVSSDISILWYTEIPHAIGYTMHFSRSHHAMIRVYDDAGNLIEAHERKGRIKAPCAAVFRPRHLRMVRSTCIKIVKGVNHASENR